MLAWRTFLMLAAIWCTPHLLVIDSCKGMSPAQLGDEITRACARHDTLRIEKLLKEHAGILNSTLGLCVSGFIGAKLDSREESADSLRCAIGVLMNAQHVSKSYQNMAHSVTRRWVDSDFAQWRTASMLYKVALREGTIDWQDTLALSSFIFRVLGYTRGVIICEYSLGYKARQEGLNEIAVGAFSRCRDLALDAGDSLEYCKALLGIGDIYLKLLGGSTEGLRAVESSLHTSLYNDFKSVAIKCCINLGRYYNLLNLYELAALQFMRGDSLALELSDSTERIGTLQGIAQCEQRKGRISSGDSLFTLSIHYARRSNQLSDAGWGFIYRTDPWLDRGDTVDVRDLIDSARECFSQSKNNEGLAHCDYRAGKIERMGRNWQSAIALQYSASRDFFRDPKNQVYALAELGKCYYALGMPDSARAYLERANAEFENIRADIPGPEFRFKYLSDKFEVVHTLIGIALLEDRVEDAFNLAESFHGKSLSEKLRKKILQRDNLIAVDSEPAEIDRQIAGLINDVRLCRGESDYSLISNRLEDLANRRADLGLFDSRDSVLPQSVAPAAHSRFLESAGDGEVALFYYTYREDVLVWYTDDGRLRCYEPSAKHEKIIQGVRDVLAEISVRPSTKNQLEKLNQKMEELQGLLPSDVISNISQMQKLKIYTVGELSNFPFEAIRVGDHYLLQLVPVQYCLSTQIQNAMKERDEAVDRFDRILVFGGDFATTESESCVRSNSGFVHSYTKLPPLNTFDRETRTIREIFGTNATVMANMSDQEAVLKTMALLDYDIVHFSTHGIYLNENVEFSGLIFPLKANSPEDNVLRTSEIEALNLSSSLVVLSSCESGRGTDFAGEGVYGVCQAFVVAGARSLIVTLWPIDDEASSDVFMRPFYSELRQGKTVPSALQHAKEQLIESGLYAHPYYWAPFIAIAN